MSDSAPLLQVDSLVRHFPAPRRARRGGGDAVIHALCGVSFQIAAGETVGIVGESGSGKTTLLKTVLGLHRPTSGSARFAGIDVARAKGPERRRPQQDMSVVFQDPYTSLDPRMTVAELLAEPAQIQGKASNVLERSREVLDAVRLPADSLGRFPHEFSGGQRQRVAIARALMLKPRLVVLDEPVSALDVSVQAEILALLKELQRRTGVSYLFVAHDLAVVAQLCDRIGVMFGGQMVELGDTGQITQAPIHPYTRELLSAVPIPDPVVERGKRGRSLVRSWPTEQDGLPACSYGDRL
jgi:ABC-type oligopeptide transport system ATPase subunit